MKYFITPTNIKTIIVSLVLFAAVPVAFAWTAAPANPPKDNVPAPVNVSASDQNKQGKLGLGGLAVFGKFQLIDGTQGVGKVLVSDVDGKATWGTISAGGTISTASGTGGSSSQVFPGWPNKIICDNGSWKIVLYVHSKDLIGGGIPKAGVSYINWSRDPQVSIHYPSVDSKPDAVSPTAYDWAKGCVNKKLNEVPWSN
jgi:hypothetical protein